MKMINLSPHAIHIQTGNEEIVVEPSGVVARVSVAQKVIDNIDSIPIVRNIYGDVENLPEAKDGTVYIVSSLVLSRISNRNDVFAPDTGRTSVRNEKGQIVAVTRLVAAN